MKKRIPFLAVVIVVIILAGWFWSRENNVKNFAECVAAGNPVMESYPRQCRAGGQTFKEDIGNELEKDNLVRLSVPRPNAVIESPLIVKGFARGNWFFEASFPIFIVDWDGKIIGQGIAIAEAPWMTTEFVPFSATIKFDTTQIQGLYSNRGTLILKKDNPSGLSENDDALEIPIVFAENGEPGQVTGSCVVTGCSGQICAAEEVITTCEFREEFACYKTAKCERQENGVCGWTQTPELFACLNKKP